MATQNKYDRQERLWGSDGQKILMESSVCLLGTLPAGVESLKNLVLPGIGFFSIIDDKLVTNRDLGNNFFVTTDSVGKQMSETICKNLLEMNPDVIGDFLAMSPEKFIEKDFLLKKYSLIISNEQSDELNVVLSKKCDKWNIKLIIVNTYGLIGRVRIQANVHTIIESNPQKHEGKFYNFKLTKPFQQLEHLVNSYNFEIMAKQEDQLEYAHIPSLIIIVKALKTWKEQYNTDLNREDEKQIKQIYQIIDKLAEPLQPNNRDNFNEAKRDLQFNLKSPNELTYFVEELLQDPILNQVDGQSDNFWILCKSVNIFRQQHEGEAPQSSQLPDMNSTTQQYHKLKMAYKAKHDEDVALLSKIVQGIVGDKRLFPIDYIDKFVENIQIIRYQKYRPYYVELEKPLLIEDIYSNGCYKWVIAIKAVNLFRFQNKRYPNFKDVEQIQEIMNNIIKQFYSSIIPPIENDVAYEMCRYEDSKLHVTGAFFGGVIAQESVKLLIHKFLPINNTFIHNGILCESMTLQQ